MKIEKITKELLNNLQEQGAQIEFVDNYYNDLPLDFSRGYDGELIQNIIIDGKYKAYTTAKYKYSYKDRRRHYIE